MCFEKNAGKNNWFVSQDTMRLCFELKIYPSRIVAMATISYELPLDVEYVV